MTMSPLKACDHELDRAKACHELILALVQIRLRKLARHR